jgi:hypothetical protein
MKGKFVLPSLVALVLGTAKVTACNFGPSEYTGPFPQSEGGSDATAGDDSGGDSSMSGDGATTEDAGEDGSMMMDGPSSESSVTDAPSGDGNTTDSGSAIDAGSD